MVNDTETGILTAKQREFLKGEVEYTGEYARQNRYQREQAIVNRVDNALVDLSYLLRNLDESARKRAFTFDDPELADHTEYRRNLDDAIAFLYLGIVDMHGGRDALDVFEDMIEGGIKTAFSEQETPIASVSADIEITHADSSKPIEDMTMTEIQQLAQAGEIDREAFVSAFAERLGSPEGQSVSSSYEHYGGTESLAETMADSLGIDETTEE